MTRVDAKSWEGALARHTDAARAFSATAASIGDDSWLAPRGEGKWSPAQVTEHLCRTYEVVIAELNGEQGIRIRSPWLLRQVLRQTMLRSIYRKRKIPKGARAPSEIVPKVTDQTQTASLERFANLAMKFEETMNANRGTSRKLTHHIFGEIELLPGIDFVAIHVEHHHRQVAG
jgi:hypothetical protein